MVIYVSIQQRTSLQRYHRLTMLLILWLIKTLSYCKMGRGVYEIAVSLDSILGSCSVAVKMFHSTLIIWVCWKATNILLANKALEILYRFKGDNVKPLITTSNCENLVLYFSNKVQQIAAFTMLFWFSVTKQSLENGFGFLQWSETPTLPASLKI